MGEQTDHEPRDHEATAPEGAEPVSPSEPDDVLDVIADVEAQLDSLRRVHAQRQTATHDLLEREKMVADREAELFVQFEQLSAEKANLNEQREALAIEQTRVTALEEQLGDRSTQLDARSKEIADAGTGLSERSKDIDRARAELDELEASLTRDRAALDERVSEVDARLEETESELDALRSERDELKASLEASSSERERERTGLQATIDELKHALDKASDEREAASGELETARSQAEEARAEAGRAAERLAELESSLNERDEEHERLRGALKEIADERRSLLENAEAFETRASEADQRVGALEHEIESLRTALQKAEASAADLERERDEAKSLAEREGSRASGLESKLAAVTEKLKLASVALAEQAQAAEGSVDASAALQSARETAQTLRAQLVETESARRIAEEKAARLERNAANRPAEAQPEPTPEPAPALAPAPQQETTGWRVPDDERRRRERLHRAKRLIRAQAAKIRRASDALGARYQQCEKLLAQRAEVVRARSDLERDRARVDKAKSRQSFAVSIFMVALALGLMGGLSFAGVKQFWPGQYAATAVLMAEPGERRLSPEDLAGWTLAHEELTLDPHFLETAADRMQRRGIAEFGSAPVLGEFLRENLTVMAPQPGEVMLELRTEGRERAQRVLETYAVTLANAANQNRARRSDGAGTRISRESTPSDQPIDQAEVMHTAAAFGGSSLFVLMAGGLVWRRMVAAKQKFEQSEAVARLMDDARWVDPRAELDQDRADA